jgi:MraZ protein
VVEKELILLNFQRNLMTTFIGDYICKVDVKGRIMLPSAFKKQMPASGADRFVVRKDIFEQCLVLYPFDEWERQMELIRSRTNPYNKDHNRFLREFFKNTCELTADANNRLLLPASLMELAGIKSDVVLAGQDGRIEIWSKELYAQVGTNQDEFASLAEKILGGNL